MRKGIDDMCKKRCFIILLVILLIGAAGLYILSNHQKIYNKEKEELLQKEFEDYAEKHSEKYLYPQDENKEAISIDYTAKTLTKVSMRNELSEFDNELILYHKIQEDGLGYAVTKYYEYDGGMGKASRRTWKTINNGTTWDVVKEEFYNTGIYNWVLMDSVLIESCFEVMTQEGCFKISNDLGETFAEIPYSEIYEYEGLAYPELVSQNESKKSVTYQWVDYHTQEAITTAEYDIQSNELRKIGGNT